MQREYQRRVKVIRDKQNREQLKVSQEQETIINELIDRLLPTSVGNRIKNKEEEIADGFKEISILFTDMKGFTAYSSTVSPVELMRFLDRMFSTFDKIAGRVTEMKIEKY